VGSSLTGEAAIERSPASWSSRLDLVVTALVAVVVTLTATDRMTVSNAMGTLLASESLVQGHWLALLVCDLSDGTIERRQSNSGAPAKEIS
jgi:hypothetical protein